MAVCGVQRWIKLEDSEACSFMSNNQRMSSGGTYQEWAATLVKIMSVVLFVALEGNVSAMVDVVRLKYDWLGQL